MRMKTEFWPRLENLLTEHKLVIDRPKNSAHPRFSHLIFPLDYGYLEGVKGGDGDGLDLWRGSDPALGLVGIVCTVDIMKKDAEIKLLVGCTEEDIGTIERFHNGKYMSAVIVRR